MNAATLKSVREALGLSVSALSDLTGISHRTLQYWESPKGHGPKGDVADMLTGRLDDMGARLADMQDAVDNALPETGGEVSGGIVLYRYRTQEELDEAHPDYPGGIDAHNAFLAHMLAILAGEGLDVRIEWA